MITVTKREKTRDHGLTLVEMMVVIAVIVLVTSISLQVFSRFIVAEKLDKSAGRVRGLLEEARYLTLSSKYDSDYGVRLESGRAVLFRGSSYASSSDNIVISFPGNVQISTTTLSGGGSDVVFERLTGFALHYGTTSLILANEPERTKAVVIHRTGLVEIK